MKTIDQILNQTHVVFKLNDGLRCFYKLSEGYVYTNKTKRNLLTNKSEKFDLEILKMEFSKYKIIKDRNECAEVFNLNYELGLMLDNDQFEAREEIKLGYYLKFDESFEVDLNTFDQKIKLEIVNSPDLVSYSDKFSKVMSHLEMGDCYQFNLTCPFEVQFNCSKFDLYKKFLSLTKLSEYAHCLYISELDYMLLSNSPECLCEVKEDYLYSKPIKGTLPDSCGIEQILSDKKNMTELNIVTDLIRNDLSKIGKYFSEIEKKYHVFNVPGLIHLCSILKVKIDTEEINLLQILKAMFPGGSISGAPKKRVLNLINEIEKYQRGFYTGSTFLFYKDTLKASINIRTAQIEGPAQKLKYSAGGGITLLSECKSEYDEMYGKVASFTSLFQV